MAFELEFSKCTTRASCKAFLEYSGYDNTGHYSLPALARLHEVIRRQLRSERSLLGPRWLPQGPLVVMVACHQEVHDGWRVFSRYRGPVQEVRLSVSVIALRKSSVVCVSKVMDPGCEKTLVTLRFVSVAIDANTRKPLHFPDYIPATFGHVVQQNMDSYIALFKDVEVVPSLARLQGDLDLSLADHHMTAHVMHSDIDQNQHANNSVHVRCAMNAVHDALRRGRLRTMRERLTLTCPKVMDVWYRREAVAGDDLDIYLWKDTATSRLHAQLHCNRHPVSAMTFTFADSLAAKL